MRQVTVIGLGAMGGALAAGLLRAGFSVTVWNCSPARMAPLVEQGAVAAADLAGAIVGSEVVITCLPSHSDTRALLDGARAALAGRVLVELSTGASKDARALMSWAHEAGAVCLIGMISCFPAGIGQADSAILTVGDEQDWTGVAEILRALAGKSARIGADPSALAAIYAGLVLPRQGFMFGMIYGAMICARAGVSMEDYVTQLPLTLDVTHDYVDVFAASVPSRDFADPPASLAIYKAAFEDVMATCADLGAPDEMPRFLDALLQRGMDAGRGDEQITALVEVLGG